MQSPVHSPRYKLNFPNFMKPSSFSSEKEAILKSDFKINESLDENFHVILFERHIEIISKENGRFKIAHDFENKFAIEDAYLMFYGQGDSEVQLRFQKDQMEIWRRQLGKRLCQKFKSVPFRIKKRISVRNLCAIYLAEQDRLQNSKVDQLAVKAFRKSSLVNGRGYEDFKNEIRIMRSMRHPNLCRLQYVYQSQNSYYICMSHYEGGTLLERHLKEPFSFTGAKEVMKQMLVSLDYLHSRGFVHRDIKPENILMQKSGSNQIVLIDFGLASDMKENPNLTLKCGTPGYVAPQIFKSSQTNPYNQKCDIFSTGVLFFWLLTRKLPYTARTEEQLKIQNYSFNFDPKKFPSLDSCSLDALDLLGKMLKRDPHSRISAKEALNHQFFEGMQKSLKSSKYSSFDREQCKVSF